MVERRAITVTGTVQGVGFRPFVFGLAARLQLNGFVTNRGGSVSIEVQGEPSLLDQFLAELSGRAPPLAHIEAVTWERQSPREDHQFEIHRSAIDRLDEVVISPDVGTCDDCLAELFNPQDRRFRYPFLNCTNCGPRLTIVTGAPYDRERTTMARFKMCAACQSEYENPRDRRFHAQPIACAVCGPSLAAFDQNGKQLEIDDPLKWFAAAISRGVIGAIKGLGGYHLVCDAQSDAAVAELRRRKHRDEKPFAVMVRDLAAAEMLCEVTPGERDLLTGSRRPIVLLRRRRSSPIARSAAPGNPMLGVMLPYTPLHHLLLNEAAAPLVMSSGNRSDEPIVTGEPECFERLAGIADVYLTHDRPIHLRCDDSVTRLINHAEAPIRRSRGYAPHPVRLPQKCSAPILAVGGQLKGTFALGRDQHAIVSHHLGDLDHLEAFRAFERDIALYEELFAIRPQYIAHDMHPDYASTRYALKRAAAEGMTLIPIQHHHAHMASCMAENGIDEPVIGVCFDGTGFGDDGTIWGGEFLIGDLHSYRRAAHLRYVPMPGAEIAIKEPWRMGLTHLLDAGADSSSLRERIGKPSIHVVEQMLQRRFNAPLTSSAGRLFDAVASILGIRDRVTFEGQAAMELEWLASTELSADWYAWELPKASFAGGSEVISLDTRPITRAIVADLDNSIAPALIARRFHLTMAELIANTCAGLREATGIAKVALSGGVFMNALLRIATETKLKESGFYPLFQQTVPVNDGGISLGQIAIAARRIGDRQCV